MKKVGVTGGIGSGKSTVCRIFNILGVPVYDADSRAKYLMNHDEHLKESIQSEFGAEAYQHDGSLNRSYLAQMVFSVPEKLKKLNALVHPAVEMDFERWSASQGAPYIIKEAALLIEAGSYGELDELIVVTAPEGLRIRRVLLRDEHRTLAQVKDILQNQYSESEKVKYANYLVNNDESHLICPQIFKIHTQISEKAK